MKVKLNRENGDTILLLMSFLIIILSHVIPINSTIWMAFRFVTGGMIILACVGGDLKNKYILIAILSSISLVIACLFSGNNGWLSHLVSIAFYLPIGMLIHENRYSKKVMFWFAILAGIVLSVYIIQYGENNVFYDISRNHFSTFMILLFFPLAANKDDFSQRDRKSPYKLLLLSIICFVVSVLGVGRAGIVSAGMILLGCLFEVLFKKSDYGNWKKWIIILFVVIIVYWIIVNPDILATIFPRFFNRHRTIFEEQRAGLILDYINHITNTRDILFGVNLRECSYIQLYNNNPHNSFISIHAYYGLFGLLCVIFSCLQNIKNNTKNRNLCLAFFIIAVMIRISMDKLAGNGIFDPIVYYFLAKHTEVQGRDESNR